MRATRPGALFAILLVGIPLATAQAPAVPGEPVLVAFEDDDAPPPLPRYREGGTPYDPTAPLYPYVIRAERDIPNQGLIESPPEYSPTKGVLFRYVSSQWPQVVADCVAALTGDPAHDEIAYVSVGSASQQTSATAAFVAAGADMSKVVFILQTSEALWIRDYGPHFIWQDGALAIVDSHYYPTRPNDNFIPTSLGDDHWNLPTYDMGLYYSGGNFQPGPNRMAIMSSLVNLDNPASAGFNASLIAELFSQYQGIDTVHIFTQLPFAVDGTGHIDMWMYLVDEDTVIISQFKAGSNATAISITNNAVPYMQNLGFEVFRPQAWHVGSPATHYTYTNAFRVNDRIFTPSYGRNPSYADEDADALAKWQAAAGPDVEIIPIDCYDIIPAAGAIHCIVMQVPRYTGAAPSVHLVSPDGGELLVKNQAVTIEWAATDTDNVAIPIVELFYSLDDGATWEHIATTTNVGKYAWTVPNVACPAARLKIVVTAADFDQDTVIGLPFAIVGADQVVYDFNTGGGVDKFGWGYQTTTWSNTRRPVNTAIAAAAYPKLANSDATGGTPDPNRYVSPNPASGAESTHVFEFTVVEDPADLDEIRVVWEGFAGQCTQVELYIWDYQQGGWANGAGLFGQNRYIDNWAGMNRDGLLTGSLLTDLGRYIDANGQLTLLVYSERPTESGAGGSKPTYHDYVAVTTTRINQTLAGDTDCSGVVDFGDINPFVLTLTDPDGWQTLYPDCHLLNADADGNGVVDFGDINPFVSLLTN